jgi:hypothetical protein
MPQTCIYYTTAICRRTVACIVPADASPTALFDFDKRVARRPSRSFSSLHSFGPPPDPPLPSEPAPQQINWLLSYLEQPGEPLRQSSSAPCAACCQSPSTYAACS